MISMPTGTLAAAATARIVSAKASLISVETPI
jgi:hypothetical protein